MRLKPGVWEFVRVNVNALVVEQMTVPGYLHFKELVDGIMQLPWKLGARTRL
ncbi:hypothetical protein M8C21_019774 [Ambrosia artemisiifolia]|uniref:Sucrose synthase N-terminal domain-containing protein n=1 Tax=Ambrosia artemisiifolia TaxID=4212 RepID=A0AAD5GQT9_AMBAR|nr:hypothetical protein M8C21_019774 [Ambrosia artemisiifolia]